MLYVLSFVDAGSVAHSGVHVLTFLETFFNQKKANFWLILKDTVCLLFVLLVETGIGFSV